MSNARTIRFPTAWPRAVCLVLWLGFLFARPNSYADSPSARRSPAAPPLDFSLIDRIGPQGIGPAFQSLDERRRGPIFAAALRQVSQAGKLPPVVVVNRDLSLATTVPDEPKLAAGTTLFRIYLNDWSRTRLGGSADSEILCRFDVEVLRDGHVERKLGPFFARRPFDTTLAATPQERWEQFQAVAKLAIEKMAAALGEDPAHREH